MLPRKRASGCAIYKTRITMSLKNLSLREKMSQEQMAFDNVVPLNPPQQRTETREKDEIWEACVAVLGYEPLTETEKRLWAKRVWSFTRASLTAEQIHEAAAEYRKDWPDVDLTINALEKWISHFLRKTAVKARARSRVCDDCGVGGDLHEEGCPRATRTQESGGRQ